MVAQVNRSIMHPVQIVQGVSNAPYAYRSLVQWFDCINFVRAIDYVLETANLFEEVKKYIDGYTIYNECDFKLSDRFVNNGGEVFIQLSSDSHPLGEIVHVLLKYKEKEISFDIPLLVQAKLSLSKLESKLINQIYQLVRRN